MSTYLTKQNRRLLESESDWIRQFACEDIDCLIICRGPIRLEAMETLSEMGAEYSILLSEKDSIAFQNSLAPELRSVKDPNRIHRVLDYTGDTKEERNQRIEQIIQIAKTNGHNAIFAGYGFMAEDENLVKAIEKAGLTFIGPCSQTVRQAGLKDEAKRIAAAASVSTLPGVDDLTARTLLTKSKRTDGGLNAIAAKYNLEKPTGKSDKKKCESLLLASYKAMVDIITVDEIGAQAKQEIAHLFRQKPNRRIRLKAVGGGGGKGQRILKAPEDYEGNFSSQLKKAVSKVPSLILEVLKEVKADGCGDNKNVLIEANIENIRHQEIQVVGNGNWCLTLGGRDCSLQMHEQKLLEVSTTVEGLQQAITCSDQIERRTALESDLVTLKRMETEAKLFGEAVGLDSVSTFECIVDSGQHYFMEMNTRIQVEHRVSELVYSLKFTNPNDPSDQFIVDSLIEAMVLVAWHKTKLPKPTREPREQFAVESRLNATNFGLQPHAGGVIEFWSPPIDREIRDDQGISFRNPDTNNFIEYRLSGAYDSNIALILTVGNDRHIGYQNMAEILRSMVIDGRDLHTNLEFHYGLIHWILAQDPYAKITTAFIQSYLVLCGLLYREVSALDLDVAFCALADNCDSSETFARKKTLIIRPLMRLLSNPHLLIGWIAKTRSQWFIDKEHLVWKINPFLVLNNLYHYLNMDANPNAPALKVIWEHDQNILSQGLAFYGHIDNLIDTNSWKEWLVLIAQKTPPNSIDADIWTEVKEAHDEFQMGLELLGLIAKIAISVGFDELYVQDDLSIYTPERLLDRKLIEETHKILIPPPSTSTDEIVAVSGGMLFGQEAPGAPCFLEVGTHFNAGDTLYIIEIMKMFNRVHAEFSGTVTEVLVNGYDGVIVTKGQTLYRVIPDEEIEKPDETDSSASGREHTLAQLKAL